jgi:hypothetical protein
MNAAKTQRETYPLPVLGTGRGLFRLDLALEPSALADGPEDPFVALSDSGRLSRVLLGRIAQAGGKTWQYLAVKIPKSHPAPVASAAGKVTLTNPEVMEIFKRERDHLAACAGDDVVTRVDPGESPFQSPPVTFCKKVRAYFHPPCPKCGGLLRECRESALLRDQGLPEYDASPSRFLACPACAGSGKGRPTFYSLLPASPNRPKGSAEVRTGSELYRDLGSLVREARPEADDRGLLEAFPCASCPHRSECYPASAAADKPILAESRLIPLSYYDFSMEILEALELHYDEAADLLGGAPWPAVRARAKERGGPGREALLGPLDRIYASPAPWFFLGEGSGRFSLEILRLKVDLFARLCRSVRGFHARTREPHLDLSPTSVMIHPEGIAGAVPARWNFRLKLTTLGGARLHPTIPGGPALFLPGSDPDKTYLSPLINESVFGREESMRVAFRSASEEGSRLRIDGTASSERARLDAFRPGDALRIVPGMPLRGVDSAKLWGVLEERQERGVRFSVRLPEGGGPATAFKPQEFEAVVAFYRKFHVPCDLYSLGMLLFRTMLANDERDIFGVEEAVGRVLRKLSLWVDEKKPSSGARVGAELLGLLDHESDAFEASHLFYRKEDRADQEILIPPRLWSDLLVFGFKLLTQIPGFSFSAHPADYPQDRPEAVLDSVLLEWGEIEERARVELFQRGTRDQEIHDACAELLAELTGPKTPLPLPKAAP